MIFVEFLFHKTDRIVELIGYFVFPVSFIEKATYLLNYRI